MKTIQIIAFTILVNLAGHAQDFQGMIVYESKTNTADFKSRISLNKDMTPEMQKTIEDRMKKMSEKTFILHFDKNASIYAEEQKLDAPNSGGGGGRMMASFMGAGGTLYKNIKEKTFTLDKEMMGKEFLIKDTLTNYKWKMTSETKKIGNYTCYKATTTRPVSKTDFRNMRPKKEDETADKKTNKPQSTNFMDNMDMPKTVEITAWYTPEIPLNQGPEGYWGLPGMILEVAAGKTVILCTKVAMNIKDRKEIKPATKGEVMTQAKYDEVIVKKVQEMQEMFQSQGGRSGMGGGGFRMGR